MAGEPITGLDELIALATGGGSGSPEMVPFQKRALIPILASAATAWAIGQPMSLWRYSGQPAPPSTNPTTAAVCTNATPGALGMTASAAGKRKYLLAVQMLVSGVNVAANIIIYDRLSHQGGLSGTTTGAQTTNLPTAALTRRTTGHGVEAWLEFYTSVGATATTATASYTNDAGSSGQTTTAIAFGGVSGIGSREHLNFLPLASGDRGVRAVASVTLAASTLSAGDFGVTLAFPIVSLPIPANVIGQTRSFLTDAEGPFDLGIASDACIALAAFPHAAGAADIMSHAWFVEK